MTIGERIRKRREQLGMSQLELAEKIGYKSKSAIAKIELDGRQLPQSKTPETVGISTFRGFFLLNDIIINGQNNTKKH